MAIAIGDRLPEATFRVMGPDGIKTLTTADVFGGKRVVSCCSRCPAPSLPPAI